MKGKWRIGDWGLGIGDRELEWRLGIGGENWGRGWEKSPGEPARAHLGESDRRADGYLFKEGRIKEMDFWAGIIEHVPAKHARNEYAALSGQYEYAALSCHRCSFEMPQDYFGRLLLQQFMTAPQQPQVNAQPKSQSYKLLLLGSKMAWQTGKGIFGLAFVLFLGPLVPFFDPC